MKSRERQEGCIHAQLQHLIFWISKHLEKSREDSAPKIFCRTVAYNSTNNWNGFEIYHDLWSPVGHLGPFSSSFFVSNPCFSPCFLTLPLKSRSISCFKLFVFSSMLNAGCKMSCRQIDMYFWNSEDTLWLPFTSINLHSFTQVPQKSFCDLCETEFQSSCSRAAQLLSIHGSYALAEQNFSTLLEAIWRIRLSGISQFEAFLGGKVCKISRYLRNIQKIMRQLGSWGKNVAS